MAVLAGLVQLYFKPALQESKGVGEQGQKGEVVEVPLFGFLKQT